MHLSTAWLAPVPDHPTDVSPAILVDLLWLNVKGSDRIEHLHVGEEDGLVKVNALTLAETPAESDSNLHALLRRTLAMSVALTGWRLAPGMT
jgi:hypothetical protein